LLLYVAYTRGKALRNSSDPKVTNMLSTNFVELRNGEVHDGVKGRIAPPR
jgi:hypothetical protein